MINYTGFILIRTDGSQYEQSYDILAFSQDEIRLLEEADKLNNKDYKNHYYVDTLPSKIT